MIINNFISAERRDNMDLHYCNVEELISKLNSKELSIKELNQSLRSRTNLLESKLNNYITYFDKNVLHEDTDDCDVKGIPIAIKDNMCLKNYPTTCGSQILKNFNSPYDSTVVELLLKSGLQISGKTNLDEFSMGSSTEHSSFKVTKNPWNENYVPGGSSGGSAAVVSSGCSPWSLGSDTGGSIRLPASYCGVVGLKPTYGLVSRYGLVAFASSLDQIGPITRNVKDNARLLKMIAAFDSNDSTSISSENLNFNELIGQDIKGLKIGLPKEMFDDSISQDVKTSLNQALNILSDLGAHIEETSFPLTHQSLAAYYIIATSEASSNLARYDGIRYGERAKGNNLEEVLINSRSQYLGSEVKRRIMLGTYALSAGYYDAFYKKAQQIRTKIINDFNTLFESFDVLISPTAPDTAFKIGEKTTDPLQMYLTDVLTVPVNLAGIPAISIPCGFAQNNMPIGMQIMSKALNEKVIYQIAYAYEQATNWHQKHPEI